MQRVAIDIETTVHNDNRASPYLDTIHCVSVCDGEKSWIEDDYDALGTLLSDPAIMKIFHGGSFDIQFLLHQVNQGRLYDISVVNVWDTLIIERLLTSGKNADCGLDSVARERCGAILNKGIRDTFKHHSGAMTDAQRKYALEDVLYLHQIQEQQQDEISARGMADIVWIENALVPIVAEMELAGIEFDPSVWDRILKVETALLPRLNQALQEQLSDSFTVDLFTGQFVGGVNLNSPDQLRKALHRIGVRVDSTSEGTLKHLLHPIGQQILDYRDHAKRLQWDYPKYVNSVTDRIHPNFVQTGADTGRFSCKDPNMQNVPHEQLFRDMFIPAEGWEFVIADYAQQELRVLAEYCQDPNLLYACREQDPHLENAKVIYSDPTIIKTDPRRTVAKGCSFGLVYGGSAATLASSAGIPLKEAKVAYRALHKKYPGVDKWARESWDFLRSNGYLTTLGGRRRYFPWAYEDPGKYMTISRNTPIQGTSADMMKLAMLYVHENIKSYGARLLLCVHDEIVVESPKGESERVARAVERGMVRAGEYYVKSVPTIVEAVVSSVWQK